MQALGFTVQHSPSLHIVEWSLNENAFEKNEGHVLRGPVTKDREANAKVAVKIVDDRGIESLKIMPLED